eukprot:4998003-Prymnesium_polylepis.1
MHTHGTGREGITRVRVTVRAHAGCEVGLTRDAGAAIVGLQTPWKVSPTTLNVSTGAPANGCVVRPKLIRSSEA